MYNLMIIFKCLLVLNVKFAAAYSVRQECGIRSVQQSQLLLTLDQSKCQTSGWQRPIPDTWPWAVAILAKKRNGDFTFVCSATLINPHNNPTQSDTILTAAHCLVNEVRDTVVAFRAADLNENESNKIVVPATSQTIHPDISLPDREDRHVDLGILKLKTPIKFDEFIRPACLPNSKVHRIQDANRCFNVGYSRLSNNNENDFQKIENGHVMLGQTFMPITNSSYGKWDITASNPTYGGIGCADSGSSLVCLEKDKWVMFGSLVGSIEPVDCSKSENWYSSTAYTIEWIKENSA